MGTAKFSRDRYDQGVRTKHGRSGRGLSRVAGLLTALAVTSLSIIGAGPVLANSAPTEIGVGPATTPGSAASAPLSAANGNASSLATQAPATANADASVLLSGPDGGTAPYLYWTVTDGSTPKGDAVFNLRGPKTSRNAWPNATSVNDCTSNPCPANSLDRDPDAGEFLLTHHALPMTSNNKLVGTSNYQIQAATPPANGYSWTSTDLTRTIGANSGHDSLTAKWSKSSSPQTHTFGEFKASLPVTTRDIVIRKRVLANPTVRDGVVATNIGPTTTYTNGTVFQLYTDNNGKQGSPTSQTCTVKNDEGACTITVTGLTSTSKARFWVVEEEPVANSEAAQHTYRNPVLYTGDYEGPKLGRELVGRTPALASSTTPVYMPLRNSGITDNDSNAMTNDELSGASTIKRAASFGAVANSRNNPALAPKCEANPLRIAIVVDQSDSISTGQWDTFRAALGTDSPNNKSVLSILKDANATASILGFGSGIKWHYGETQATSLAGKDVSKLLPVKRPLTSGTNATNWDAALSAIDGSKYDMVLFVTDGAPNMILGGTDVDNYNVTLRSLEAPIYAANAIKDKGARVVAVGVGNGAKGSEVAANLRAVSGTNTGVSPDYIQGDWTGLKEILTSIVSGATCQLPISVSKTTIAGDGTTTPNAPGWTFGAAATFEPASGPSLVGTPSQVTGSNAAPTSANWSVRFTEPAGQTASVTISETIQPGWTLSSLKCNGTELRDSAITANGKVSVTLPGLSATSGAQSCVFTNRQASLGELKIVKALDQATVPAGAGTETNFSGAYVCKTGDATVASGTWTSKGPGDANLIADPGTPAADQIPAGALCTVTEDEVTDSTGLPNPSYVWDTALISDPVEISHGQPSTVTVTNRVERVYGNFEIQKVLATGSSADTNLTFGGTWQCTPEGEDAITGDWGPVTAGTAWSSSTSDKKIPLGAQCAVLTEVPSSSWPVRADHSYGWDGARQDIGDPVTATDGEVLELITVTNYVLRTLGEVTWSKVDSGTKALLGGSTWTLTGPGATPTGVLIEDCVDTCNEGPLTDQDPRAGQFKLTGLLWGSYELAEETAPPGYGLVTKTITFVIGEGEALTIALPAIENSPVTPPTLPLTGGLGRDFYAIVGFTILALAAAAFGVMQQRTRRREV